MRRAYFSASASSRPARAAVLLVGFALLTLAAPVMAGTVRIATYNVELDRDGPGLLLRDIVRGEDPQIAAIAQVVARVAPDVLVLQNVDYDLELRALRALRDTLSEAGTHYPHFFARRPNSGMPTGLDMDGDGRAGEPRDAQSYGEFSGQGGMAILSRYPVDEGDVRDFSPLLWRDLPGALLPALEGKPFPSKAALDIQRLSSVGHWVVPIRIDGMRLDLLAFHASPPVFDGPEDRNGRRNHDEILFWRHYLDGQFGPLPEAAFVVIGDANLDPLKSDGRRDAITALLTDPRLQDPRPPRSGATSSTERLEPDGHLHTAAWPAPGPGSLRVDYILPAAGLRVTAAGVFWPAADDPDAALAAAASRHRPVWVDLSFEPR